MKKILIVGFFIFQLTGWIIGHSYLLGKSLFLGRKSNQLLQEREINKKLEKQVAQASSLLSVKQKSQSLNLTPSQKIVTIDWSQPVAFRQ